MACAESSALALSLLACALAAGAAVAAGAYKWIDESGRVQYSDRIPPDAVNRGMVELDKQGMPRKVTEPAPTPEQRQAIEDRLERERQAEKRQAEARRQENALLASYTSEQDIEVTKQRNLALIGGAILGAEARIKALERRVSEIEREKLFYVSKPLPDRLVWESASVTAEILKQRALIAERNEDALALINKFDRQIARFRELKARVAAEAASVKKQ